MTGYKGYKIFHLQRVAYGKPNTPVEQREYQVTEFQTSAVDCINEIADFVKTNFFERKIVLRTSDSGDFKFNFEVKE